MNPQRQWEQDGHRVAEYVWNGEVIVYIDRVLASMTYEQAVVQLEALMKMRRLPPPKNESELP